MYSKFWQKANCAVLAAAMLLGTAPFNNTPAIAEDTGVRYEFEDAQITGDVTVEKNDSASGGSCLKMTDSGTITLTVKADAEGMYNIVIYTGGIGGAKQQNLSVNGTSVGTLAVPESDGFEKVVIPTVKLKEGENTIVIEKSWGWSNFDYLTIETAELAEITASQTTPCDPDATKEAQALMSYLASVYGSHIISGQQEIYNYGPHDFEYEFEYLNDLTGHYPALRGFDYGNFCCPAFGSDDGSTERVIDWVKNKNGIAESTFHLNVPVDMSSYEIGSRIDFAQTTYSEKTDFSPSKAIEEGTKENQYYMQALTTLAEQFGKLQDEGIPVIWRPLHEAEGGGGETGSWFWWGREGSKAYKDLWIYTYKTLTEKFGLHNLIWEWNSYDFATSADWYPGDEYVDIIGYDKYSCTKYLEENGWQPKVIHDDAPYSSTFYNIMEKYDSKKMVSMAENDSFSTVDNITTEKAGWLYFMTWYDGGSPDINFLTDPRFNTEEDTIAMYQSDYCITLDELPKDLYTNIIAGSDKPTPPTTTATTTKAPDGTGSETATTTTTAEDFTFEIVKEPVEVEKGDKSDKFLYFTVKGTPGASVGGGVGFANGPTPDDWVNVEWQTTIDKDGFATVKVPLESANDDVTSTEIQIWWSNLNKADQPVEITESHVGGSEEDTGDGGSDTLGDANLDGNVTIADCVAILQFLANSDEYALDEQALVNADVESVGNGVNTDDALAIQKLDAGQIDSLPVVLNENSSVELPMTPIEEPTEDIDDIIDDELGEFEFC